MHLCADSGFFTLFAGNVQEGIDFTYIARRVSEETLVPGLVIMDGEQTAIAAQDARLLSPTQAAALIGPAGELIDAPTAAQKLLFGETRRRIPAWHDLDEPMLSGALFETGSFALGASARRPYFDAHVSGALSGAFDAFAAVTGRQHEPVSRYQMKGAQTVLIAQGAAVEVGEGVALVVGLDEDDGAALSREVGEQRAAAGLHRTAQFLDEIVRAHHEHAHPRMSGDRPDVEDRGRCLDHRPDRQVGRCAGGVEPRPDRVAGVVLSVQDEHVTLRARTDLVGPRQAGRHARRDVARGVGVLPRGGVAAVGAAGRVALRAARSA